jgi:hypothetical protein
MNTKHTQGNWNANEGQIYPQETGKTLALIPYFDKENEEMKANSKLIASAPELLKALQTIQSNLDTLKGMTANREQLISIYNLITESNKIAVDTLFK